MTLNEVLHAWMEVDGPDVHTVGRDLLREHLDLSDENVALQVAAWIRDYQMQNNRVFHRLELLTEELETHLEPGKKLENRSVRISWPKIKPRMRIT